MITKKDLKLILQEIRKGKVKLESRNDDTGRAINERVSLIVERVKEFVELELN